MSGPTKLTLQDLLRAQQVKRWHIVNTCREQTLAEHNYNVATIALSLYNDVVGADVDEAPREIAMLVLAALYHDANEVRTGDIPTPGKRLLRHFGGEDLFHKVDAHIGAEIPFIGKSIINSISLVDFYVMADHIDAAYWIREHGVGSRAREVADKCWRDMEDLATKLSVDTGTDWRGPVNNVLSALLCPHLTSSLS